MARRKHQDHQHATIAQLIALSGGITIKRRNPKLEDFLPNYPSDETPDAETALEALWQKGFREQESRKRMEQKTKKD